MTQLNIDQLVTRVLDLADRTAPLANSQLANSIDDSDRSFDDHLSAVQPREDRPSKTERTEHNQQNTDQTPQDQLSAENYTSGSSEKVQIDADGIVPDEEVMDEQKQLELAAELKEETHTSETQGEATHAGQVGLADQIVVENVADKPANAEQVAVVEVLSEQEPNPADKVNAESASDDAIGKAAHSNTVTTVTSGQNYKQTESSDLQQRPIDSAKETAIANSEKPTPNAGLPIQEDTDLPNQQQTGAIANQSSTESVQPDIQDIDPPNPAKTAQQTPLLDEVPKTPQIAPKSAREPLASNNNQQQAISNEIVSPDTPALHPTDQHGEAAISLPAQSAETGDAAGRQKTSEKQVRKKLVDKVDSVGSEPSPGKTLQESSSPALAPAERALASPDTAGTESRSTIPQPPQSLSLAPNDPGQSRIAPPLQPGLSGHPESRQPITEAQQARFVQRVASAFQSGRQGDGEVRIRLHPPELGALRMQIKVEDGVMVARLETETQTARQLLLDNLPALRERLAGQDIRVERFDVDVQDQSTSNREQRGPDQDNASEHRHERTAANLQQQQEHADENDDDAPGSQRETVDDSILNVVI